MGNKPHLQTQVLSPTYLPLFVRQTMVRPASKKMTRSAVVGTATPSALAGKTVNRLSRGSGSMKSLEENLRVELDALDAPVGVLTFTSSQRRRTVVAVGSGEQDSRPEFIQPFVIGQQGDEATGNPAKKESKKKKGSNI